MISNYAQNYKFVINLFPVGLWHGVEHFGRLVPALVYLQDRSHVPASVIEKCCSLRGIQYACAHLGSALITRVHASVMELYMYHCVILYLRASRWFLSGPTKWRRENVQASIGSLSRSWLVIGWLTLVLHILLPVAVVGSRPDGHQLVVEQVPEHNYVLNSPFCFGRQKTQKTMI